MMPDAVTIRPLSLTELEQRIAPLTQKDLELLKLDIRFETEESKILQTASVEEEFPLQYLNKPLWRFMRKSALIFFHHFASFVFTYGNAMMASMVIIFEIILATIFGTLMPRLILPHEPNPSRLKVFLTCIFTLLVFIIFAAIIMG